MKSLFVMPLFLIAALATACSDSDIQNDATGTNTPLKPSECASFSERDCTEHTHCMAISGWVLNETEQCRGIKQFVEYQDLIACEEALGVALDPSGQPWLFPNLCFPAGWSDRFGDAQYSWAHSTEAACDTPESP